MTPARKAALRKAQMASARKRKRKGKPMKTKRGRASKRTRAKAGVKVAAAVLGAAGVTYAGKRVIRKKAENNMAIRTAMTKKLMAEARARRKK
jgi:hypothetical protein